MRNKLLNKFYKFYKIMFINFLNNKCSWTIFVFLILNYVCLFVFLFSKLSMIPLYLSILSFSLWNLIVIFLYYFCILFYFYAFCDSLYVLFSVLLLTYFLLCILCILCIIFYLLKKKYLYFKDFLFIIYILLCIISRGKNRDQYTYWKVNLLTFLKVKVDRLLGSASRILLMARFH